MPLVYQQNINECSQLGVWHITEPESYFLMQAPLHKEVTHPHKRLQHLAGRYILKELFPLFPLDLIRIADTRKPHLQDEAYHFSISHCGDYAAALVSTGYRVGIDVELVQEKIHQLVHKFLSPSELLLLRKGLIRETAVLFWSVKETIFKWKGSGGMDFKEHMQILSLNGDETQGTIRVLFAKDEKHELVVHYLFFNSHYLSWVLTPA